MTTLLDRAIDAAGARGGRDLSAFRTSSDLTALAALATTGADGGTLIPDVPILKAGSFHGGYVQIDQLDLLSMVERYGQLAPDVFVPPVRIDHGWSVKDVIGHIAGLRVATLPDPSNNGVETPYLLADLQILNPDALAAIKAGTLRNRSSELGPYEQNNGTVWSLVCWGVAFVDVPAVEGLGDILLASKMRDPHKITTLTEDHPVTAPTTATTPETPAPDAVPGEQGPGTEETPAPDAAAGDAGAEDRDAEEDLEEVTAEDAEDQADDEDDDEDEPEAQPTLDDAALAAVRASLAATGARSPASVLRQLGLTDLAVQLETQQAAELDRQVTAYAEAGKLGRTTRDQARALLGHHDPAVTTAARALLDALPAAVTTGTAAGRQQSTSSTGPSGADAADLSHLADATTATELGALWAQLSHEQRTSPEGRAAYSAARAAITPAV